MCPGELLSVLRDASSMGDPHVSEINSPPRVCAIASKYGTRAGFSLDLTVLNDEGIPWDFDRPGMRLKAKRLVMETKPKLLIGSPMCRAFSILQGLNRKRMGEQKYQAML